MGSSSSRPQPVNHTPFNVAQPPPNPYAPGQQGAPFAPPGYNGMTNGQFYSGFNAPPGPPMPRPYAPPAGPQHPPPRYPGHYPPPPRPVATHEYHQTQTIKNQVNLKKQTLKLVPVPDQPNLLSIQFAFDASAPCRVSTFVLTLEEPKRSCKITTGSTAPTQPPVYYGKGLDQHFPAVEQPELAAAHAINTSLVRMDDLLQQYNDNYPLIIRLEALSENAAGHALEQLPAGESLPPWVQAQTTYAKVQKQEDGSWGLVVLKQKIWVKGVSYELQEIYGMEQNRVAATGVPVATTEDDVDGRECVICLSNERDTTVLPCRHMCMCQECASALKTQTNKCPICRMEIESLLHIKIQRKAAAPEAAPVAAAPAAGAQPQPAVGTGQGSGPVVPPAYAQPAEA